MGDTDPRPVSDADVGSPRAITAGGARRTKEPSPGAAAGASTSASRPPIIGAARGRRGEASSAQSGHQEERRRSRPGRWRCSSGVATKTCPASQSQHRYTSAAGGIWLSTMPSLYSGRYCRTRTG
ncbi:hypothetical protein C5C32_16925 [Rathayibacter sp. AY1G9]|nr:hypothetical protein C5C32_16925 [Rathayibacter sp. AY1G9]